MYLELYNLLLNSIFGGQVPSALSSYLLEFFTLLCIFTVIGIPFFIIYAFMRRFL